MLEAIAIVVLALVAFCALPHLLPHVPVLLGATLFILALAAAAMVPGYRGGIATLAILLVAWVVLRPDRHFVDRQRRP